MTKRWLAAWLVLAVGCALAATWPAATSPRDTLLCNFVHPDCLSNHWLMVWVAEQIGSGGSILHNDRYYWPVGDAPWLAGNGSEGFAYLPWHLLFGWPLASNVHLIGLLVLNGLAAGALARASGASPAASLSAVPAGALLVYVVQELGAGRFTQVSVCWLGFFLAAWLHFLARPSIPRALLAAALLAVSCLFYWYYGLFGVLAGGVLLLAVRPVRAWGPLAAFSGAFLLLVGPLLWVFLTNWTGIVGTGEEVFPHPEAAQDATWPGVPFLANGGRHAGRALPFTVVALALLGLGRARVRVGLALVALLFAGLMAGPLIPHGPYEWVYGLAGPLRRFWWPYRHVVVLNLALVALAAHGLDRLVAEGRRRTVAGVVLALSVPVQLTLQGAPWHAQFSRAEVPVPFYQELAGAPGTVLLEPPLYPGIASSQTQLLYQLDHRKALLNGHALWVDRVRPPAWDAMVAGNSFLSAMQALERGEGGEAFRFEPADLQSLIDRGLGVLVVNREYFPIAMEGLVDVYLDVCSQAFGAPIATGKRVRAWDLTRWDGRGLYPHARWDWPPGIRPGGPTLSIQGYRAPSLAFSVPGPPPPPKGAARP